MQKILQSIEWFLWRLFATSQLNLGTAPTIMFSISTPSDCGYNTPHWVSFVLTKTFLLRLHTETERALEDTKIILSVVHWPHFNKSRLNAAISVGENAYFVPVKRFSLNRSEMFDYTWDTTVIRAFQNPCQNGNRLLSQGVQVTLPHPLPPPKRVTKSI